jgi:hypothetical protein
MANTYDVELMPRIMAGALMVLREACPLATLVEKDFDGAAGQVGQDVIITRPTRVGTSDVTPAATPPAALDVPINKVKISLTKWKRADPFSLSARDATFLLTRNILPNQIKEQARALANQLSSDLLGLYQKVPTVSGTPGTNPFASSINTIADVRDQLNRQLCPDSGENRHLIVGYDEETAALKLEDFKRYYAAGDTLAFRQGQVKRLYGMNVWRDSQRPIQTAGSGTGWKVSNGGQPVPADSLSLTLSGGTGGANAFQVGDIVSFGDDYTYAVAAWNAATGLLTLYPCGQAQSAGGVTQRVNCGLWAAVPDQAPVTVLGVNSQYKVNLGLDPRAIGLVMRVPPSEIEGAEEYGTSEVMVDPVTGIPIKLYKLPGYHMAQWELSILYGCELIDDRLCTRLVG